MSVDPEEMLMRLEAENQEQSPIQQPAFGGDDPEILLDTLEDNRAGIPKSPQKSIMRALVNDLQKDLIRETERGSAGRLLKFGKGMSDIGEGVKQLSLGLAEEIGLVPEGSQDAFTQKTDEEKRLFIEQFNKDFGDEIQFDIAELGGKVAPFFVLGPLSAPTAGGQVALGTGIGAATGATAYIPKDAEETRLNNTLWGAGLGGSFSALFNTFPAARQAFRKWLGASARTKEATSALQLSERTGIDFKLTQITDDPLALQVEKIAEETISGQRAAGELAKRQINQATKFWVKAMRSFDKKKSDFGDKLQTAFNRTLGDPAEGTGLLGARARQAKIDYKAVQEASKGKRVIPVDNFNSKLIEIIKQSRSSENPEKVKLAKQLLATARRVKDGKVSGIKMQDLMETYGNAAKGSGRIFSDIDPSIERGASKALFKALSKDLDKGTKGSFAGAAELKAARDNYLKNSQAIDDLEKSGLYNLFGAKVPKTSDELKNTIMNMKADKIKGVMGLLHKTDPELKRSLQRFWVEEHLRKATKLSTFDTPNFNPETFLSIKSGKNEKAFNAIFDTPESRRLMNDGIEAMQRIIANNNKLAAKGLSLIKNWAGVAASKDKTFVARLGAEVFTPRALSKYANTKDGVDLLRKIADSNNTNIQVAALIKLGELHEDISFDKDSKEETE